MKVIIIPYTISPLISLFKLPDNMLRVKIYILCDYYYDDSGNSN